MCAHLRKTTPVKYGNYRSVYGLADASRYWRGINTLIGILACHIDDMIWGGNQYFKGTIISKLKEIFNFGHEEMEAFTYIETKLKY